MDGNWDEVEKLLKTIDADSVEYYSAKIGRGRWKLESGRRMKEKDPARQQLLEQALADFREVLVAPPLRQTSAGKRLTLPVKPSAR